MSKHDVPPYFQCINPPRVSYTYTKPIASKLFNYKHALSDIVAQDIINNPPPCSCSPLPTVSVKSPPDKISSG